MKGHEMWCFTHHNKLCMLLGKRKKLKGCIENCFNIIPLIQRTGIVTTIFRSILDMKD